MSAIEETITVLISHAQCYHVKVLLRLVKLDHRDKHMTTDRINQVNGATHESRREASIREATM